MIEIPVFTHSKHSSQGRKERIEWIKEKLKPFTYNDEIKKTNITVITTKTRYYLKWLQFSPTTRKDYEEQILFELELI